MRFSLFAKKKKQKPMNLDFSVKEPKTFAALPSFKRKSDVAVRYTLLEQFAYADIKWSKEKEKIIYRVIEPDLSAHEKDVLKNMESMLTESIDIKLSTLKSTSEALDYLIAKIGGIWKDSKTKLDKESMSKVLYYVYRDFIGLNEIEAILHDPYIEDIGCTGVGDPIFVVHRAFGSIETSIAFENAEYLSNFVIKLSEKCNRYISYATPLLDGTLPDGSRIQASFAKDVTTKGPTFSIRKFRKNPLSPIDILGMKTVSAEMMAYFWHVIEHGASILICGGTSSGKTTLLNALSMFIKRDCKIISIEDTREINLYHKNWIPTVTRAGFGLLEEGGKRYGEISMFDLLKESFRMKPDFVIVGEIRGEEAYVMFQGVASGHPSMGTMHASSVDDVIKRLSTPPIELSPYLIETLDSIVIIANAKERGETARRVKTVAEILSVDPDTNNARTITTFSWIPSTDEFRETITQSQVLRNIAFETGIPYNKVIADVKDRKKVLEWMTRHKVFQYNDVTDIVSRYSSDKEGLMKLVRADKKPVT